jgi:hypothetical protein
MLHRPLCRIEGLRNAPEKRLCIGEILIPAGWLMLRRTILRLHSEQADLVGKTCAVAQRKNDTL